MQEGDPSHALYVKERQNLLDSLHRRASKLYKSLNELEGITCNEPEGALYCMPRIRLSKKVLEVSSTSSRPQSLFFCFVQARKKSSRLRTVTGMAHVQIFTMH